MPFKHFKFYSNWKKSPEYLGLFFVFGGYFIGLFILQVAFKFIQMAIIPQFSPYLESTQSIIIAGLTQDISAASYISGIVLLFGLLNAVLNIKILQHFLLFITGIVLSLMWLFFVVDIFLLQFWSQKISTQALHYLNYPSEIAASFTLHMALVAIILMLFGALVIKKYLKITVSFWQLLQKQNNKWFFSVFVLPLIVIGIRGGVQNSPVDIGSSMQFEESDKNTLAVNGLWNGVYTLLHSTEIENIELFKSKQYLSNRFNLPFTVVDTSTSNPLVAKNTNVILIVMEGVSAELSQYMNGREGNCMPFLDSLASIGISSKQMYATGDRTDKGIVSILSGWPGQPWESILHTPEKLKYLPNISSEFYNNGYNTTFLYGGDSRFANIYTYLKAGKFQQIIDKNIMDDYLADKQGKWGYHDHSLFNQLLSKLQASNKPEFFTFLTLSTHEPYDCIQTSSNSNAEKMMLSVQYLDNEIQKFWYRLSRLPQFENTIVIFTSDHGKDLGTINTHIGQRNFFHIPLIIAGGGVPKNLRGHKIEGAISQTDLYNSVNDLVFGRINPKAKYSRSIFRSSHTGKALFNLFQVAGVIEKNEIYWMGTDKMSIRQKSIKNQQDSIVLSVYTEIISDFFELNETF